MTPSEAIAMAEKWTSDMQPDRDYQNIPLFDAMKALLAHIDRQGQDIVAITEACQGLLRRNRELENELRRSQNISPSLDGGDRSKT